MAFVSVTRLRLRSVVSLPLFFLHTMLSIRQVKRAPGYRNGALLADRAWTFWTLTVWDDEVAMRAYMLTGSHRTAMPYLVTWCDEASVVHWEQPEDALPSWPEADRRMRAEGRPSKLRHPSTAHAELDYRAPRLTASQPLRPARPA